MEELLRRESMSPLEAAMGYARNGVAAETTPFTVAPCDAGTAQALTVRNRSRVKLEGDGVLLSSMASTV